MARRGGQLVEYVGGAHQPFALVPRVAVPGAPVTRKWGVTVRDGAGRVVVWRLFDSEQAAHRFARERAAGGRGGNRVASVQPFTVERPAVPSHGETAEQRRARLNRLGHHATERAFAFAPVAVEVDSALWDALGLS